MDQAGDTLPIRLRPRNRSQIFFLIFFGFFFVFAIVWMIGASRTGVRLTFNDVEVTDTYWRAMFPLFGIPFALIGICGLAVALLKVLPSSPCYYLELSPDGLTYRTLLTTQSFAWRDLPPFTSLEVEDSSDDGKTVTHYAAAMMDTGKGDPREIIRISASEYGTENNRESAAALAARLNRVREASLPSLAQASARALPPQEAAERPPSAPAIQAARAETAGAMAMVGTAETYRLPVRLLPRKGHQLGLIAFFGFFFGFSVFWMGGASGILDLDNGAIHIPPPGGWAASAFGLFGLPFAVVGICGIGGALLRMLPNSPYYHIEISADGLLVQSLFKQARHAWRDLPAFETLQHKRRTKNGTRTSWYTVAMEGAPLEPGTERGASHQREVLRIDADGYGAKNGEQDAANLAAWLNQLREMARDKRLSPNEMVEVPEGFARNAITVAAAPRSGGSERAPTVVRR